MIKLSSELKIAKKEDFYKDNKPKIGMKYFVYSYHNDKELEERIVYDFFEIEKLEPWLSDDRVFVYKKYHSLKDL
jgi:hypothetical protein